MKNKQFIYLIFILLLLSFSINAQIRNDFDRSMNQPVEPFNVISNIYYVGASDVASYLITTPKGHILIDSGFLETVPMIEANFKKLGFDLKDVKIILINHAHSDHAGGLKLLKEKTGAKLYAIKEEVNALETGDVDNFRFGDGLSFTPVKVDKVIKDGQTIKLGGVKLKTYLTPGHTKGSTTWTTTVTDKNRKLNVIFLSSTSTLDYNLIDNPKYPDHYKDFMNTFAKLKKIKVDVFLGSHAQFFEMKEKLEVLKTDNTKNPFIDPNGYKEFIKAAEEAFLGKLNKQREEKKTK